MKNSMVRAGAGVFAAALVALMCWSAPLRAATTGPMQVAQATATDAPTAAPTGTYNNSGVTSPTATESPGMETSPMPGTTAPASDQTTPSGGTAPAAGSDMLNNNPNGSGWLSKFARNPGPATTMTVRRRAHRVRTMMHHPMATPQP